MMMNRLSPRQRGFSLIEILVGVLIGLICTVVIANVLALAESRRRGTTQGSEAQLAGASGLYSLSRELQSAGYGFASEVRAVGCNLQAFKEGVSVTHASDPARLLDVMTPVRIYPAASDDESDQIRVLASGKTIDPNATTPELVGFSLPVRVISDFNAGDASFVVNTNIGVQRGDLVLAVALDPAMAGAVDCYLMEVSGIPGTDGSTPPRFLVPAALNPGRWNMSNHPAKTVPSRSFLANLGSLSDRIFSVDDQQRLVVSSLDTATMTRTVQVLQNGIVKLKALYGRDTDDDGDVDVYDTTQPTTAAQWRQVLTLRVAIVAQSGAYERDEVTSNAPLWRVGDAVPVTGSIDCAGGKCLPLSLGGVPDWKHYRYAVFDTVVGLRNQRWRTAEPMCGSSPCP